MPTILNIKNNEKPENKEDSVGLFSDVLEKGENQSSLFGTSDEGKKTKFTEEDPK